MAAAADAEHRRFAFAGAQLSRCLPYATLWTSEFHEMLLVGSMEPIELDAAKISQRFQQDTVRSTLQDVGIGSAPALMATWVTDRAGLEGFAGDALTVTDDQPRIEYASWVRAKEISRVLPALLDLRLPPPLLNADAGFIERTECPSAAPDAVLSGEPARL